jgi:hypothetical protein
MIFVGGFASAEAAAIVMLAAVLSLGTAGCSGSVKRAEVVSAGELPKTVEPGSSEKKKVPATTCGFPATTSPASGNPWRLFGGRLARLGAGSRATASVTVRLIAGVMGLIAGGMAATVAADREDPVPGQRAPVDVSVNSLVMVRQRPGVWSVLGVTATNPADVAGEGMVSVFFPPDSHSQWARRLWVPSRAERTSWLPLQIPAGLDPSVARQPYKVLTLDATAGRDVLKHRAGEGLVGDGLMLIGHDTAKTCGYLAGMHEADSGPSKESAGRFTKPAPDADEQALETLAAAREAFDLEPGCSMLHADFLPPWSECLDGYDQMLLANDRIVRDTAGLAAVRGWVRNGGRLWIMVDRVQPATLLALLGNALPVKTMDRVELDRFTIDSFDDTADAFVTDACDLEEPAGMVRVVATDADVPCRVDGWPAAVWLPYGEGEVLLTMLGSTGWRSADGKSAAKALRLLAKRLFSPRKNRPNVAAAEPAIRQLVGYRVAGRRVPLVLLGGYCLTLLAAGIACARRGRPERLLWIVPIASVMAAGLLVGGGVASARSVPPTVVAAQLLRVATETDEGQAESLLAIYDQRSRPVEWQAGRLQLLALERPGDESVNRREWTDDDTVVLPEVTTRAGSVESASVVGTQPLEEPVAAVVQFGPDGLSGRLSTGRLGAVADAVILSPPAAAAAVSFGDDGRIACRPDQILPADDFSANAILSEKQRWRQDVMRTLFDRRAVEEVNQPRSHALAFWCDPVDQAVSLPDGFEKRGTALAIMPLEFRRTPADTEFRIPANFLRATNCPGPRGRSTMFDARTGRWRMGRTAPGEVVLRFALPPHVLPCRLQEGVLTVRLAAPSRSFTISSYKDRTPVVVQRIDNPDGVFECPLMADHLGQDERGGVRLVLAIGPTAAELVDEAMLESGETVAGSPASRWQIDYAILTVAGRTLPDGGAGGHDP